MLNTQNIQVIEHGDFAATMRGKLDALTEAPIGDRYDETCGMESFDVFARRLLRACFVEDYRKALKTRTSPTAFELSLNGRENLDRLAVELVRRKRADGYYNERINPPAPAVLPQDLQAASEVKPVPAGKTVVIRNGTELHNPEWRKRSIDDKHDLHYETNHGIDGKKYVPASINYDTVARLIRTGGLTIEGDMPDWVRELVDEAKAGSKFEARPEQSDDLYGAIAKACRNPIAANFKRLPSGFYIEEQKDGLHIKHFGLPNLNRLVGTKLVSGVYGPTIQKGEVGRLIVLLLEANKAKQATQKTGPTPIGEVVKRVTKDVTKDVTPVTAKRDTEKSMVKVGNEMVVGL